MSSSPDTNTQKNIPLREAASHSGYSTGYLSYLCRTGKVIGKYSHNEWAVDKTSLEVFIKGQAERKEARARALAHAREEEYQRAQRPSKARESRGTKIENRKPILHSPFSTSSTLRSQAVALATAFLVVGTGALAAQASFIPQLAEKAAALAHEVALGFGDRFGDVPSRIAENVSAADSAMGARIADVAVANEISTAPIEPLNFSSAFAQLPAFENASGQLRGEASRLAKVSTAPATEAVVTIENLKSFGSALYENLASPSLAVSTLAHAYTAIGAGAYADIVASLDGYRALVERSGADALALGATTRDTLATAPRFVNDMNLAFGTAVIGASHALIGADVSLAYRTADAAPASARTTVALIGGAGDLLAGATARVPALATTAYLRATAAPAVLAPALASAVFDSEYAMANRFVPVALDISGRYLALVKDTGDVAYAGTTGALALANATGPALAHLAGVPAALQNTYLGALGKSSLAFGTLARVPNVAAVLSAAAPTLNAGEQFALATYETIRGLVSSTTSALAMLFGSSSPAVIPTRPVVALATSTPVSSPNSQFVIHNSASSSPLSNFHSPTSTAPTAPSYPTYVTNLNGVSVNDVKQLLAAQRSDILATVAGQLQPIIVQGATNQTTIQQVNMIQNLSDLVNVGATTASFGSLTAGGASVTGGVLVNGGIVSNTSATAPFFAATSAAATSTFAGAVGIGTTTPQGNLDVAGTSHFRSDTYLSGFIDFNRSQLEGSLDTSVAIAARTPAGLTGVNASGYNAIWTLPSSGTVGTASFNGWYSRTDVPAVAATYQQLTNMYVGPTQIGAAATINNWTGLYVADQTINGSGLTKALDLGIGSGTGKFNIYAAGTAPNYFAGNVGIGTTSPYAQLSIATPNGSTGSLSTLFTISSSTQQGATSTLVSVFANGSVAFGSLPKNGGVSLSGSSYPYGIYDQNDSNSALTFSNQTAALGATANLNFNISGSQKMTINSSGSVGIGTTSPWGQLSVNPNGITGPSFVIGSSTATNFIVTNGGLVGIGTANPQRALEIDSTGTGGSTIRLGRQTSSSYSSVDYYPTYNASPSVSAPSWSSGYYGSAGNNGYSIWSFDNSSNAIRFYIDPTGSVGIGTTSPAQTFSVAGNGYFTGGLGVGVATTTPGVFQTSGDAKIGGNLTVVGNSTTLGQSSANTLVVNASVSSDIIPTINGSYSLGSSSFYWKNLYVGTLTANSVSAASTTIGGTQSKTFTLDSANATADADNQSLIFMRGSVVPNALLTWNSAGAAKRFEFNQPLFIQDASASTTNTTFTLQSVAGQTGDIFHVASSSSATTLFNITGNGNVGVGTVSPITQFSNTATILADSNGIQVGPGGITWIAPAAGPTYAAAISQSGASAGNRNALLIKTAATDNGSYILRAEGGGGPAFVATAAGNVGIGTTSPYAKLSIQGAGTGTGANLVTTNSNQKPLLMVLDNGNAGLAYNGGFGGGPGYLPAVNTLPQAQFQIATPDLSDGGATVNWAEVISTYYGGGTGADSGGGVGILFSHTGNTGASSRSAGISSVSEGAYSQNVGLGFYTTSGYSGTPTERMRITGAGNVGIGTTNPGQKLEVNGYSQFDNTGTDGGYTRIGEIDNHRGIYTNGGPFAIAVGGGGSIILNGTPTNNTGNVGIGTTSPRSYEFAGSKVLDLTGSAITTLSLHGGGTAQEANVVTDGTGLYLDITGSATASNNGIHFRTSNVNSDYNAFEKMTILSSGNVGIGTTTPTSKLFVYDASGGATVANFQTPGGGLVQFTNGYIQSNSGLFDLWGTAASGTRIGAGNAEAMRILANGNVGIGTTTPWGRLSVTGAGTGTGVGFIVADSNNAQNFKILDNGNVNIGNSATINAGKVVIQTSSAPGTSDGTLSPLRLEYAGGDVSGTIGAGVAFSQRYDSVDTSQIRVGAIYGYKEQPSGGFGGGLAFYTQPAGAGNMTERMRINMTGNIGIGLTTPIDSVLTINANSGNASTIGGISLLGTNTNYGARMTVFDTGTGIQEQFILKAAGVYDPIPAMVIGGAGNTRNVGIGTTSPQWPLDVYKSDSNSMRLDSLTGNETFILSRGTVSKALFGIAASAGQIIPGSATDDFAIRSGQRILFSADGGTTGHMVIQNNGNVGIGTTTPASILDIKQNSNGSAGATIRLNNQFLSANSNTELQFISGDQDSNATSKIVGVSKSTGVGGITGEMAFYTKTSGNTGVGLAERVRIDSNGNVGIGTVNPGQKLEVNGNALIDGGTLFIASSLGSFQSSIIGAQTQAATGNSFYFNNSGGGTLLTLAYSGNVGIGTTTPAARLDVQSSLAGATAVFGSVGHSGYLQFRRPSDGGANGYVGYAVSDTADAPLLIQDANGGGEVRLNAFANSGIVSAYTNNTERMRITSTGNVGIGTTSPRARLNVVQTGESYTGGQSSYDSLYPSGYNTVLESRNFPSGLIAGNLLVFSNTNSNGNDQAYVGSVSNNTDNGASSFVIGQKTSATVWTERMRIDTAGNVGIGTTGPRGTLEISSATAPQFFTNYTGGAADAKLWDIINNGATLQFRAVNDANSSANPWLTVTRSGTTITSAVFPNGNVGIGTSSPFANLSIHANNGSTNTTLFAIASSTASATTTLFSVDNTGTVLVSQSNADNKLVLQSTGVFNARMGFNINSARAGEVGADTTMTNALGWYGVGFYGGNGGNMGAILSGPTSGGNIVVPELNLGPNAFNSASNYALVYQSGFGFSVQTGTQSALAGLNASAIGIGTTSPYAQLSISNSATTPVNGTLFAIASTTGGTSTSTLMAVLANGNVGIGTASPAKTLDVSNGSFTAGGSPYGPFSVDANGLTHMGWAYFTNLQIGGFVNLNGTAFTMRVNQSSANPASPIFQFQGASGQTGDLTQWLTSSGGILSTINSQGFLGIGTSSPFANLSIHANNGSTNTTLFAIASSTASATTTLFSVDNTGAISAASGALTASKNGAISVATGAGQVFFTGHQVGASYNQGPNGIFQAITDNTTGSTNTYFQGITGATTNFSVRADGQGYFAGNVGIGTTSPMSQLALGSPSPGSPLQLSLSNQNGGGGERAGLTLLTGSRQWSLSTLGAGNGGSYPGAFMLVDQTAGNSGGRFAIDASGNTYTGGAFNTTSGNFNGAAMTLLAGGNVGIGTTSPYTNLAISSAVGTMSLISTDGSHVPQFTIGSNNGGAFGASFTDATSRAFLSYTFDATNGNSTTLKEPSNGSSLMSTQLLGLKFNTNNAERMRIDMNGNVGVGTTSPWGQLSVNPNGVTGPAFVVGSSTATNFIVTNGGNVGIGTSSPAQLLSVQGNGYITGNLTVTGRIAAAQSTVQAYLDSAAGYSSLTSFNSGTGAYGDLWLRTVSGTSGGVWIKGVSGNVGVGTTSPYSTLSVWGTNTTAGVNMFELTNSASTTLAAMDNAGNFSVPVATATTTLGGGLNVNSGGLVYDLSTGITSPANLNLGATAFDTDAGVVQWVDMPVTSASAAGTVESYTAALNANPMLTVYGLADGLGGMTNLGVGIGTTTPAATLAIQNAYGTRAGALFNIASSTAADGSASTNFFTVTNAGNVGIGTTSPTTMLVVSNTNPTNGQISIGGFPTQGFGMELYNNGSLTGINAYNRNTTAWRSLQLDGSSIALNTNSYGNVGIGTTSPYANLSVMAGSDYGPHALSTVFAIGSSTAGTATTTLFSVSNTGNASISNNFSVGNILTVTNQANLPGVFALGVTSYGTSDLGFNTTNGHALTFGTNGTEAMRVTGSNVGIGTTSPWGQLSVNPNGITGPAFVIGSSTATNFVVTNAGQVGIGMTNPQYGKLVVQSTAGTGKVVLDNYVVVPTTENVMSIYADATNGYIQSYNNGWKNIVIAPSGGNVGIGTSSPQQKLEVLGTIRSSVNSTYYSELTYNGGMRLSMASPSTEVSDSMQFVINGGSASTAGNAFLFKTQAGNTTPTTVFSIGKSGAININTLGQGYVCSDGAGLLSFGATCATSDARLKTNIVNISSRMDVLAALEKLNGVYYNWDLSNPFNNGMSSTTQVGMIAQNVEQVFPELVYYGTDGYARLDYQKLVGFLVEVNKAQQGEITSLNQRTSWMQVASSTATSTAPVMTFDPSTGNIGIGTTTPNHTLTVAGDVGAIAFVNTSTRDAKTDISYVSASTTDDMLSQLVNLKVATYRYKIESQQDPLRLGFIAEDAQTIAPEILSPDGKGVDLYKLATFNLAATQALAAKVDAQNTRLTSLEARVTALENGSISSASGSPISLGTTSLASAMNAFGAFIQKGIAQFGTLVADRFVAATNSAGTSSAGTVTILAGNTVAQVANAYVTPSTKIFVTFTASTTGSWYIGDKQNGSFKVVLESPQAADTSFDYFLVQTQGQIATSTPDGSYIGAPGASQGTTSGATAITLLGDNPMHLPVGSTFTDPGIVVASGAPYITFINGIQQTVSSSTIDTSAPTTYLITYKATDAAGNVATAMRSVIVGNPDGTVSTGGTTATSTDTTAPVVTLNGAAAMQLNVGDTFTDPGATALDNVDGDLTAKIAETGSVNTATAGSYSLTYSATDAAGNTGSASRLVTVVAPTTTTATSTTP